MRPVALVIAVTALSGVALVGWQARGSAAAAEPAARVRVDRDTMRLVPQTVRIKIEVLNASGERGAARRAMLYLRDRGFDVVSVGNASQKLDSSVVLDRSGNAEWAALALRALGGGRVEIKPDSSRYLDLTVLVGSSFRAPAQILYP